MLSLSNHIYVAIGAETQSNISHQLSIFDSHQPEKLDRPNANVSLSDTGVNDFEGEDDDIPNIIAAVILHPNFRETVIKLAEHDLVINHNVNLADYPIQNLLPAAEVQQRIFGLLVPILTQSVGDVISGVVSQNGIQANTGTAYYPGKPLPPDIQQGIFEVFTSILKNPIFTNVVTGIVKDLIPA
jgi:hypothetical protein